VHKFGYWDSGMIIIVSGGGGNRLICHEFRERFIFGHKMHERKWN
jgi:hypothetical protein